MKHACHGPRRAAALAAAFALGVAPAAAQYSRVQLHNWNNAAIFPNMTQAVSPSAVNGIIGALIDNSCVLDSAADCVLPPGTAAANLGVSQIKQLQFFPGADPTGVNPSDSALAAFLSDCASIHETCDIGPGKFSFADQTLFDTGYLAAEGVRLRGEGCTKTQFTYTGSTAPAFRLGTDTFTYKDSITFTANPGNGQTIVIGASTVTFVTSGATGNQVDIGGSLSATLTALQTFLAGSGDPVLSDFTYTLYNSTLYFSENAVGVGSGVTVSTTVAGATVRSGTLIPRGDSFYSALTGIGFVANVAGDVLQIGRTDNSDLINSGALDVCVNNGNTGSVIAVQFNGWLDARETYVVANNSGAGIACDIEAMAFSDLRGSCSNAATAVHVTGTSNQFTFSNTITDLDMETITGTPVLIDAAGGQAPTDTKFIGGQYAFTGSCAINAVAGADTLFLGGNLQGSAADFCNSVGASEIKYDSLVTGAATAQWELINAAGSLQLAVDTGGVGHLSNFGAGDDLQYSVASGGNHRFYVNSSLEFSVTAEGATLPTSTVSALPACNSTYEGTVRGVTDANSPSWGSTVAGSGAVHTPVYCNGTAWIAI